MPKIAAKIFLNYWQVVKKIVGEGDSKGARKDMRDICGRYPESEKSICL